MLVCPSCGKPARVGFKITGTGKSRTKQRFCRTCDKVIVAAAMSGKADKKKDAAAKPKPKTKKS
jgi:hypothetical protein